MDTGALLAAHDAHVRTHVPDPPPLGAVVERDGPLVSVHYGTHAVVDHTDTTRADVHGLVRRVQDTARRRTEPVEWRVHSHDSAGLAEALLAAGFTPGWERSVLVAPLDAIPDVAPPSVHALLPGTHHYADQALLMSENGGPHRRALSEQKRDGIRFECIDLKLIRDDEVTALAWFHLLQGTPFVAVEGMSTPCPALLSAMAERTRPTMPRTWGWWNAGIRFVVAEADGDLRRMYLGAGFHEVTTVRSQHWSPPGVPADQRPVRQLLFEPEHDDLWDRFYARFSFAPSVNVHPAIREPAESVTWFLDGPGPALDQAIVPELLALARADEPLYWLDWNHAGYRFDPSRVGGPGRPGVPGQVFPDGDYYIYTTADLRLGTFGHPWENTLCVFGRELLDRVEDGVTALLGEPTRRGGRNTHRVWTFGPDPR
ncbi:uncharacterized protein DUF2716 [Nocardiopsis sp. Huas11]|uniref:DUF2716 domain-containing protein n=1 Tax=Nocardiopsis sp. Huas11 TaxID=2183912 RepID=UPI000F249AD0|nr:DUF2716 domain-containing protein [Nocardiopsis sp. Huas11]RKS08532.1 uncharacterized protein DUF2716 [Nocardiopsis sp. Huas11]